MTEPTPLRHTVEHSLSEGGFPLVSEAHVSISFPPGHASTALRLLARTVLDVLIEARRRS